MKYLQKLFFACLVLCMFGIQVSAQKTTTDNAKKIQVAILLDVSGSMDGLIEQAKSQLWNMVTVLGKAKCATGTPGIEIALYEYGRTTNDAKNGYVKQLSGFTTDLDKLSAILFGLRTDGGEEFCGHVIKSSLEELPWDPSPGNYKVIFIAGNEDFLQGGIRYTDACSIARQTGVIVNTIYCGERSLGVKLHWNLSGECGQGSYSNINHNAKEEDFDTPFDSAMYVLNDKLNATYITYGKEGAGAGSRQIAMDKANSAMSKKVAFGRVNAKASKVYNNASWDLYDANVSDSNIVDKIDFRTLPDSLQHKTKDELKLIIKKRGEERLAIQKEIGNLNTQRNNYINEERKRRAIAANDTATLETEIEKILKEQARRFEISFE